MSKILMHTCCAPCSEYVVYKLQKEGYKDLTYFWYNPNIHGYDEYKKRRDCLVDFAKTKELPIIVVDDYGVKEFTKAVSNNPEEPFRCAYCNAVKIKYTAEYAVEHGYDAFTTTLLVSPYQKHDMIKKMCELEAERHGIDFVYYDFREGFRIGQEWAKRDGLYLQDYCGCIYSEYENKLDVELGRDLSMDELMKGIKEVGIEEI